jgi:putative membrane protein
MMSGMGAGLTMGLMGVVPLLVIALIVWVLLRLGSERTLAAPPEERPLPPPNRAFAILAERYARGEITREEFLEHRRDLQDTQG